MHYLRTKFSEVSYVEKIRNMTSVHQFHLVICKQKQNKLWCSVSWCGVGLTRVVLGLGCGVGMTLDLGCGVGMPLSKIICGDAGTFFTSSF